ncbi:hypothetical protein B0H10DRAFT_916837 [Mycena sp. CBHHK59/15]|nr:hypothetical protein B0H10DRAFT_916837 [Mycena sp. CBHHK59/15]
MVALLAGAVCAAVSVFCVGLVRDCADTLYMCHRIDHTAGESRGARTGEGREEIWGALLLLLVRPLPRRDGRGHRAAARPGDGLRGLQLWELRARGAGWLGGGPLPPPRADEPAYMRAHAEEPPYVRARRTSEEENRKVPPPEAYSVSPDAYSARMERSAYSARDEPSRGPHSSQDFIHPHPQAHPDSDSDSLDEGGGESSGMFPGSGFF